MDIQTQKAIETPQFKRFWLVWPRKIAKQRAVRWFRLNKPTDEQVGQMLWQINHERKPGGRLAVERRFIPYPETWLNDGDWMDAPTPEQVAEQAERQKIKDQQALERKKQEMRDEYGKYCLQPKTIDELKEMRKNNKNVYYWWLIDEIIEEKTVAEGRPKS